MKWGFLDLSDSLVQAGSRLQCLRWNGCVVQSVWRNQPGWTERQLQSDSSTACHHCLCSCSRSILVHNSSVAPCQGRDLIYLNWNISKSTELAWHPNAIFPLVGMQYKVPGCSRSSWSRVDKLCCTHTDASHSDGTQEQAVISGMEQIHRADVQNSVWASKSPCG